MDDEIDRLMIAVRADTSGFAQDVATMKGALEQGVGSGADRAGRSIESALTRAVRTGKLGFDDLRGVAVKALEEIAAAALKGGVASVAGSGGGGGLAGLASGLLGAVLGLPGRATGGPVSPGAAYLVGERGPELFVPTSSGSIAAAEAPARDGATAGTTILPAAVPTATPRLDRPAAALAIPMAALTPIQPAREVKVAITIGAPAGSAPQALARSGRQVARAVARALEQAGG